MTRDLSLAQLCDSREKVSSINIPHRAGRFHCHDVISLKIFSAHTLSLKLLQMGVTHL